MTKAETIFSHSAKLIYSNMHLNIRLEFQLAERRNILPVALKSGVIIWHTFATLFMAGMCNAAISAIVVDAGLVSPECFHERKLSAVKITSMPRKWPPCFDSHRLLSATFVQRLYKELQNNGPKVTSFGSESSYEFNMRLSLAQGYTLYQKSLEPEPSNVIVTL